MLLLHWMKIFYFLEKNIAIAIVGLNFIDRYDENAFLLTLCIVVFSGKGFISLARRAPFYACKLIVPCLNQCLVPIFLKVNGTGTSSILGNHLYFIKTKVTHLFAENE